MAVFSVPHALTGNLDAWDRYWITAFGSIYHPDDCDPFAEQFEGVIEHELRHIEQQAKWGFWWYLCYSFLPVPVFFAWWRYKWERECYLIQIQRGELTPDEAADLLWGYFWPWPKPLMRRWFRKHADG